MKTITALFTMSFFVIVSMAGADTITVDGETYEDVYVREASAMVFIQVPQDGSIIPVSKSNVDELVIHSDEDHRKALLAEWEGNRALSNAMRSAEQASVTQTAEAEIPAMLRPVDNTQPIQESETRPTAPPAWVELRVNGNSHRVDARRVNLAGVLEQLAHPMEPDAAVRQGRIRLTNTAPSGTRNRTINEVASRATHAAVSRNTVPRIVVNNPSGSGLGSTGNPRLAGAGAAGFSGGMGTTGIGTTAGGIGTTGFGGQQGGFGGQMGGFGGQRGGFGGQMGGVGGQMGGGGFGAGAGAGAAHFSNISQLFTNINDMMVGEAPAQIGLQASFWQSTPPIPAPGGWANPERLGMGGGMAGQMGQMGQPGVGMGGQMGRPGVGMTGQMGQPGVGMAGQMGRRF